ncbi:MAG: type II toxin-antitoxin system VapC family toxin [Gemmatimonadetes bacterium]|nr:type II toxin-antitoxin system VapC family toxin [Gemmatimonadota bacterium]
MPPSVYIETSIVSYLVARPSRDPLMAERQRQTRDWWANRRGAYRLLTSEKTLEEARRGEAFMARSRVAALAGIPLIPGNERITSLAEALLARGPVPMNARSDAYHIAIAAVEGVAYLLTWDRRHIANPSMTRRCEQVCREFGCELPVLCTPEELLRR